MTTARLMHARYHGLTCRMCESYGDYWAPRSYCTTMLCTKTADSRICDSGKQRTDVPPKPRLAFACWVEGCDESFITARQLAAHIKAEHPDEYADPTTVAALRAMGVTPERWKPAPKRECKNPRIPRTCVCGFTTDWPAAWKRHIQAFECHTERRTA